MSISEEFHNALRDAGNCGGGISQQCECGIIYFAGDGTYNWEKDELENYLKNAKEKPKEYINNGDDVSYTIVNGKYYVIDCSCRALEKLEKQIWANRFLSASYIEKRGKKEFVEAEYEWEKLKNIKQTLKEINDKDLTIKKLFWPINGNIKSMWREDKFGNRLGLQRDWFENGNEAANFEWQEGEYQKLKKRISATLNQEKDLNWGYFVSLEREKQDHPIVNMNVSMPADTSL